MTEKVAFVVVLSYEGVPLEDEEDSYESIEAGLRAWLDKLYIEAARFPDQSRSLVDISVERIPNG